jgi:hypothetical protein
LFLNVSTTRDVLRYAKSARIDTGTFSCCVSEMQLVDDVCVATGIEGRLLRSCSRFDLRKELEKTCPSATELGYPTVNLIKHFLWSTAANNEHRHLGNTLPCTLIL